MAQAFTVRFRIPTLRGTYAAGRVTGKLDDIIHVVSCGPFLALAITQIFAAFKKVVKIHCS